MIARRHPLIGAQFLRNGARQDIEQQSIGSFALQISFPACLCQLAHAVLQFQHASAQFEMRHDLVREATDGLHLLECQFMGLKIDHAKRTKRIAFRIDQRHPAIEPQVRFAGHRRVVAKPLILAKVAREHQVAAADSRGADRHFPRHGVEVGRQSIFGLVPITRFIDQADDCDRTLTDLRGQFGDLIIGDLRRGIE
jgi:hypothetical protein